MGGLSSSLGLGGGKGGSGFSAPQMANVVNPVTGQMTTDAYNNTQTGLTQQNAFLQALQGQNGVGNQSQVFNQLQGVANGTGPNPAQAQLAQSTGQNVSNQAALMAGQRGASSNVGMMARQAAQQGANTQQQAAGQASTLQANQSLNALNSMGSLATNQVAQQSNATNAYSSAAQGEQSNLYNMLGGVNSSNTSSQNSLDSSNAALIGQAYNNQNGMVSNFTNGAGSVMSMLAEGGEVDDDAPTESAPDDKATVVPDTPAQQAPASNPTSGPQSTFGQAMQAIQENGAGSYGGTQAVAGPSASSTAGITANPIQMNQSSGGGGGSSGGGGLSSMLPLLAMLAKGGQVPALVSPGEQYLKPKDVKKVKEGKNPLAVGERIPGKPKFPGNDYRNDVIPKKLESGGIVIPNKIMQSKDPAKAAAAFVTATLAKKGKK